MKQAALESVFQKLLSSFDDPSLLMRDIVSGGSNASHRWLAPFLHSVAASAVESGEVQYSKAVLFGEDDAEKFEGKAVIITSHVVVSGYFEAKRTAPKPDFKVHAWNLAAIERIDVEAVNPATKEGSTDPRQQGSAIFTLHMPAGVLVQVPPRGGTEELWEPKALQVMPKLLAGSNR
ncbi:hypothetical protein PED38_15590 [Clavibacter sp. CT19]|uniref:hypothetical protein n=1 Tax=Clavibacter sp. CT19 TaxID=3018990 RepID=UPI0022EB9863|nr:hypothetical protein [Clavibacter sp. CT19]MDA3806222.1 hypothetical protein [Clavibacter sp. CT19]